MQSSVVPFELSGEGKGPSCHAPDVFGALGINSGGPMLIVGMKGAQRDNSEVHTEKRVLCMKKRK